MKIPPNSLLDVFNEMTLEIHATEKKFVKLFEQFYNLAFTEELRSSLSPERNELELHIDRLAQVLKSLKLRPHRISSSIDEALLTIGKDVCGYKKQQSKEKDVQILHVAKLITYHKISLYGSMEQMAKALKLDNTAKLLAQSLEDNKNAGAYFTQIEQNILYPAVVKEI